MTFWSFVSTKGVTNEVPYARPNQSATRARPIMAITMAAMFRKKRIQEVPLFMKGSLRDYALGERNDMQADLLRGPLLNFQVIFSAVLYGVHKFIGPFYHGAYGGRQHGKGDCANAERDRPAARFHFSKDHLADAAKRCLRPFVPGGSEQNDEFVAAHARKHVAWPQRGLDELRNSAEQFVANIVAQGVVHLFKIVKVKIGNGNGLLFPAFALQLAA